MVSTSIEEGVNNNRKGWAIKNVESFIEKMRNQDIVILYDKARSIIVDKDNNQQLLSEALASSITSYEMLGKRAFSSERENLANICI